MQIFLNQFIKYKVHLGHKKKNTSLLSSWYLYKLRTDIWIINLYKTLWMLKLCYIFIKHLIIYNKAIWFINMDLSKQAIIQLYSNDCGEFACTGIWLRGLFSNYFSMYPTIKKYLINRYLYQDSKLYNFYAKWYLTRETWPRAIFISNLKHYNIICKEAFSLFIPIIGIIDTNIKHQYFNFPIPSNDDSHESLTYICSLISKYILLHKYKRLILWAIYYRDKYKYDNLSYLLDQIKYYSEDYSRYFKINVQIFNKLDNFLIIRYSIQKLFYWMQYYNLSDQKIYDFNEKRKFDFYEDLLFIGWYKKYIIYKNIKQMKKKKRYYIINLYKYPKYRQFPNSWFYILYFLFYFRYFRIFIETFMSNNFYYFFYLINTRYGLLKKPYLKRKVGWRTKFVNKSIFIKNEQFPYLREHLTMIGSTRFIHMYFRQLYLILFIKVLNFNIFSLRIKNIK